MTHSTAPCPRCGSPDTPGAANCPTCGLDRSGAPPAGAPAPPDRGAGGPSGQFPTGPHPGGPYPAGAATSGAWGPAPGWQQPPPYGQGPQAGGPSWNGPQGAGAVALPFGEWARRAGLSPVQIASGDWGGAVLAALAGIAAMLVYVGLNVAVILGGSAIPNAPNPVGLTALGIGLAMGAGVGVSSTLGGQSSDVSASFVPLGVTLLGLTVVCLLTVRGLRRRGAGSVAEFVSQAVRVWLVWLAALLVLALVGRVSQDNVTLSANVFAVLFFGTTWLAAALLLVLFWKLPHLLPPRTRMVRDAVAGPFAGAVVTLVLGAVLAAIAIIIFIAVDPPPGGATSLVAVVLLLLPNAAYAAVPFAVGVPLSAAAAGGFGSSRAGRSQSISLLTATDTSAWYWFAPLLAAVVIIVGGIVAALHATDPQQALRRGWALGPALALVFFAVSLSTGAGGNAGAAAGFSGFGSVHLNYGLAILFGLLWGAVGGMIGAALAPRLPSTLVQRVHARAMVSRGAPSPGMGGYPPGYPGGYPGPPSGPFPPQGPSSGQFPAQGPSSGQFPAQGPSSGQFPAQPPPYPPQQPPPYAPQQPPNAPPGQQQPPWLGGPG